MSVHTFNIVTEEAEAVGFSEFEISLAYRMSSTTTQITPVLKSLPPEKKSESNGNYDLTLTRILHSDSSSYVESILKKKSLLFLPRCSSSGYQAHSFTRIRIYFFEILVNT